MTIVVPVDNWIMIWWKPLVRRDCLCHNSLIVCNIIMLSILSRELPIKISFNGNETSSHARVFSSRHPLSHWSRGPTAAHARVPSWSVAGYSSTCSGRNSYGSRVQRYAQGLIAWVSALSHSIFRRHYSVVLFSVLVLTPFTFGLRVNHGILLKTTSRYVRDISQTFSTLGIRWVWRLKVEEGVEELWCCRARISRYPSRWLWLYPSMKNWSSIRDTIATRKIRYTKHSWAM